MQEESQRGLVQGSSSTSREDEENVALTSMGKKKFKKILRRVGLRSRVDRRRT